MKPSLTLIVPAFNEQDNLGPTVSGLFAPLDRHFSSYEVLIFDDGSTDQTVAAAERLRTSNPNVKVIRNEQNRGLGYSVSSGFQMAAKEYVMWYPADDGMEEKSLNFLFSQVEKADILITYIANPEFRSRSRQALSSRYVNLMNFLFGLKLKYFNGVFIYKSEIVKSIPVQANRFGFFAELLVQAVKAGASYLEVPTYYTPRLYGNSKVFNVKNVTEILGMLARLVWRTKMQKIKRPSLHSEVKTT